MRSKSSMENNLSTWNRPMGCNQQRQMFPSIHGTTPHSYAEQCPLGHHNFPKNEPSSSSFFHFSPSLYHNNQFLAYNHELLSRQFTPFPHPPPAAGNYAITSAATDGVWCAAASTKGSAKEMIISSTAQNSSADKTSSKCPSASGRKRGSNRERHSKIITAQGLRDRRMRLSVDVAHEFFGLQDMLGFDKASKTVGWLMRKSKAAIKELTRNIAKAKGGSESSRGAFAHSTSESEDISGIDETATVDEDQQEDDLKQKSFVGTPKGKRIQESPKATHSPIARESRAIARSKARERTREKMTERLEKSKQLPQVSTQDPTQLSPLSPLGSAEESGSHSALDIKSLELGVEINEPNRLELSMFDYDHQYSANSQGMSTGNLVSLICSDMMNFFPENWDMDSASARSSCCDISNTHLFAVDQGEDDPLKASRGASMNL